MASLTMILLTALLCNYGRGKCLIDVGTEGELHRQMERLQEDSLRALQPQIRELERHIGRLQEEKMRELELDPKIQELHKKLDQLREQRARQHEPQRREP